MKWWAIFQNAEECFRDFFQVKNEDWSLHFKFKIIDLHRYIIIAFKVLKTFFFVNKYSKTQVKTWVKMTEKLRLLLKALMLCSGSKIIQNNFIYNSVCAPKQFQFCWGKLSDSEKHFFQTENLNSKNAFCGIG
jgi:hypothetical protein